jgi:diacylglycerol O-acyltransferase / wax synthase
MDRLSADDARILALESAAVTGQTMHLIVLEPGQPLDVDALRTTVAQRLSTQPRATERADTSGSEPRWAEASEFDVDDHVRRRSTSTCATQADLWQATGTLMSEHLDRSRPLWTFDVIGPLDDGREAIAVRIHHAMADGITSLRFLDAVLWDPHADPPPISAQRGPRPPEPDTHPRLTEAWRMSGAVLRELGHFGSHSPFDRPITISRELAFTVLPLGELKSIGAARPVHATVNDVLLGIVAGGLRDWLGSSSATMPHLRAQVPVSLHYRDETADDLGNRDSFLNVDLPLAEADPLARIDRVSAETRTRKMAGDAEEMYDLFHALGRMKHLGRAAERLAGSAREFGLSISNVPGPRDQVSVAGRAVQQLFCSSEPAAHHALRISSLSCAGELGIGLCTDPNALPGVARLADAIDRSFAELRRLSRIRF